MKVFTKTLSDVYFLCMCHSEWSLSFVGHYMSPSYFSYLNMGVRESTVSLSICKSSRLLSLLLKTHIDHRP